MKRIILFTLAALCSFSLFSEESQNFKGWKKADTQHFTFIYENSSKQTVDEYAKIADTAWNKIANIYSIPGDHFDVYVTDRTNTVNAFTYFSPTEIGMFTTPPSINDFGFRVNWRELFFTHELIHAANITFEDKSKLPEIVFGPFYNTFDFTYVPGWALEGLTTVLETELSAGGRGRSPYFEIEFKGPALENTLISYSEIGMETEPPRGQSYIMGYLIMRSIADRWGIQALADIERNRNIFISWEDSVKLVTGYTPDEIYRDVKIALTKKYAKERSIPEGITISPRTVNTNYYKPAVVFEDGSLITMRNTAGKNAAIVKLDPSKRDGSNYLKFTKPLEDMNTVFKETVLIEGYMPEPDCVTADQEGTVYVSMGKSNEGKLPGVTVDYELYKWTLEYGLKKLTKKGTYLQPAVSGDGKTLVAIHQNGLTYDIVKIDINSGKVKLIVQDESADLLQPSLNYDGSKIAFLAADGTRAKLCVKELDSRNSKITDYDVVYNGEGLITDPSYPTWNGDTLVFTDNQRGRLESFEIVNNQIRPVVSDPVGVLWSYKNDKGIYYSSFSGSGYVLKMKPADQWGSVPDFNGPSMPGEIMTFGSLEVDYPDFVPYEKLSEVELTEEQYRDMLKENAKLEKGEPIPVYGKVVKHRNEKSLEKLEKLPEPLDKVSDEKLFIPFPKPLFYIPVIDFVKDIDDSYFGLGAAMVLMTPKLQMKTGVILLDCIYYPEINNFKGSVDAFIPLGTGQLQFMADRIIESKDMDTGTYFAERNLLDLGYVLPLYKVDTLRSKHILNIMGDVNLVTKQMDPYAFAAFAHSDYSNEIASLVGLEYTNVTNQNGKLVTFDSTLLGIGLYSFDYQQCFAGFETELNTKYVLSDMNVSVDADAKLRYTDFPLNVTIPKSLVKFNGKLLNSEYPGRAVFQLGTSLVVPGLGGGLRVYEETMISYGENTYNKITPLSGNYMNLTFHDIYATGIELGMNTDGAQFAAGYSFITDFTEESFISGNFYITIKADLFRY